jgi:capsular polysaccharide biosynthesis protein
MTADETARRDVDVGSSLGALTRNWWVILVFVVVGAIVGVAVAVLLPKTYDATASVYLGQSTDASGNLTAGLTSNAKAAAQLLSSQGLLERAAKTAGMGMTPAILRRETSIETPTQTIRTTQSIINFVVMTVRDESAKRAARAADALAEELLARISQPVDDKIALLEEQIDTQKAELSAARDRSRDAQRALDAIATSGGDKTAKAVAAAPYLAIVQAAATEQQALLESVQKSELMLHTTVNLEKPVLLHGAAPPDQPSSPDLRLSLAAGALAGLVIGVVVAFVRQRRAGEPAQRP